MHVVEFRKLHDRHVSAFTAFFIEAEGAPRSNGNSRHPEIIGNG